MASNTHHFTLKEIQNKPASSVPPKEQTRSSRQLSAAPRMEPSEAEFRESPTEPRPGNTSRSGCGPEPGPGDQEGRPEGDPEGSIAHPGISGVCVETGTSKVRQKQSGPKLWVTGRGTGPASGPRSLGTTGGGPTHSSLLSPPARGLLVSVGPCRPRLPHAPSSGQACHRPPLPTTASPTRPMLGHLAAGLQCWAPPAPPRSWPGTKATAGRVEGPRHTAERRAGRTWSRGLASLVGCPLCRLQPKSSMWCLQSTRDRGSHLTPTATWLGDHCSTDRPRPPWAQPLAPHSCRGGHGRGPSLPCRPGPPAAWHRGEARSGRRAPAGPGPGSGGSSQAPGLRPDGTQQLCLQHPSGCGETSGEGRPRRWPRAPTPRATGRSHTGLP